MTDEQPTYVDGDGVTQHGVDPATFPKIRPLARKVNRQPDADEQPRPLPDQPRPITGEDPR